MEKKSPHLFAALLLCLLAAVLPAQAAPALTQAEVPPAQPPAPIPFSEIGAHAQKQYTGDGLAIIPDLGGAQVRCVFQKLEGQLTGEGLWLRSTVTHAQGTPFRVLASGVGRAGAAATRLLPAGQVEATDKLARLLRPGLTEEYSVSVDGVRQDFVVLGRPAGTGALRVELAVAGARALATTSSTCAN